MGTYSAIPRAAYREQPRRMPRCLGFERYALGFNGSSNYVNCGSDPSLDITHAITIEAWVKPNINDAHLGIVTSVDSYYSGWLLQKHTSNKFMWSVWDADGKHSVESNSYYTDTTKWHHLVGVRRNGVNYLYVDGIEQTQTDNHNWAPYSSGVFIGRHYTWNDEYMFNGTIALVRIYGDYALTPEEIRWNMLNYNNPVHPEYLRLWLPMEEGSGLTVYDKSGHGNNGSLLPADDPPTWERVRQYELRAEVE